MDEENHIEEEKNENLLTPEENNDEFDDESA